MPSSFDKLLTEAILLSLLGGVFGLGLGYLASRAMSTIRVPTDLPLVFDFHTDLRVVLFTAGMSVLAGVVFGLIPAIQASRNDLVTAIKATTEPVGRRVSLSSGLVVLQVAVSLALLVVAGLFLKSIGGARTIDPKFRTHCLALMSLNPGLIGYDRARTATFYLDAELFGEDAARRGVGDARPLRAARLLGRWRRAGD